MIAGLENSAWSLDPDGDLRVGECLGQGPTANIADPLRP